MADEIFTQRLLNWAVKEKGMEALKLVIPIVEDKYRITSYGFKRTPGTGGKLKSYIYSYIPFTLIGMSYESKKNAHLKGNLGASLIRLDELGRMSN